MKLRFNRNVVLKDSTVTQLLNPNFILKLRFNRMNLKLSVVVYIRLQKRNELGDVVYMVREREGGEVLTECRIHSTS